MQCAFSGVLQVVALAGAAYNDIMRRLAVTHQRCAYGVGSDKVALVGGVNNCAYLGLGLSKRLRAF